MNVVSSGEWAEFRAALRDSHDTFFNKPVIWKKATDVIDRFGEDPPKDFDDIPLKALMNYNYMRSWPITMGTETGELDRQSVQMLLSKYHLREAGYINGDNYFEYDPAMDRFVIDGLVYKPSGDTAVSQEEADDSIISIILRREETPTGDER